MDTSLSPSWVRPLLTCNPEGTSVDVVYGSLSSLAGPNFWPASQAPPPLTDQQIRRRMIYNTYDYSLSNAGHEFTQVLTDDERRALST